MSTSCVSSVPNQLETAPTPNTPRISQLYLNPLFFKHTSISSSAMKIESILNQSTGLGPGAESKGDRISPSGPKNGPEGPYFSLPTPSPECAPSKTASGQPDSRTRTPWDAGGYSLPREPSSNTSLRSSFAFLSPRDHRDTARPTDASSDSNYHSRRMSMETSTTAVSPGVATPYSLPVRYAATSHRYYYHTLWNLI